ncbi:unnamed protein product [Paramecium sonneborni]|uniref:Uncharacterized protein n=1 Tax=Paramecium sonneborni TaxID=65129 RepID=A0A8S1RDU9_9CILI|nr:unnamed protein product [Paramecium sonneborni]CAD8126427.1 unnamed protein product [Paramecium sonneborni]
MEIKKIYKKEKNFYGLPCLLLQILAKKESVKLKTQFIIESNDIN